MIPDSKKLSWKTREEKKHISKKTKKGMNHPHRPGACDQVKGIDRRNHFMFEAFVPNAVENDVGHVELSDLDHTKSNDTDQNKLDHPGVESEKAREKPNRDQADERPEKDFKEMKTLFSS